MQKKTRLFGVGSKIVWRLFGTTEYYYVFMQVGSIWALTYPLAKFKVTLDIIQKPKIHTNIIDLQLQTCKWFFFYGVTEFVESNEKRNKTTRLRNEKNKNQRTGGYGIHQPSIDEQRKITADYTRREKRSSKCRNRWNYFVHFFFCFEYFVWWRWYVVEDGNIFERHK